MFHIKIFRSYPDRQYMRKSYLYAFVALLLSSLIFTFQNCSKVDFNKLPLEGVWSIPRMIFVKNEGITIQNKTLDWNQNGAVDVIFTYKKKNRYDRSDLSPKLCLDVDKNNFTNCHRLKNEIEGGDGSEVIGGEENDTVWLADIDRDGKTDIVLFNVGRSYILLNRGMSNGKPQYERHVFYDGPDRLVGTVADLNHNNKIDLAYVYMFENRSTPITSHLKVIYDVLSNGQIGSIKEYSLPNASVMETNPASAPHTIHTVELSEVSVGGGAKALFIKNQRFENHYLLRFKANQSLEKLNRISKTDNNKYLDGYLSKADFNGDGMDDILIPSHNLTGPSLLLSSNGIYHEQLLDLGLNGNTYAVVVKDVDRDGHLDIVSGVYNSQNSNLGIFINWGLGDMQFAEPELLMETLPATFVEFYTPINIWDMDSNGMLDLLVGTTDQDIKLLLPRVLRYQD